MPWLGNHGRPGPLGMEKKRIVGPSVCSVYSVVGFPPVSLGRTERGNHETRNTRNFGKKLGQTERTPRFANPGLRPARSLVVRRPVVPSSRCVVITRDKITRAMSWGIGAKGIIRMVFWSAVARGRGDATPLSPSSTSSCPQSFCRGEGVGLRKHFAPAPPELCRRHNADPPEQPSRHLCLPNHKTSTASLRVLVSPGRSARSQWVRTGSFG